MLLPLLLSYPNVYQTHHHHHVYSSSSPLSYSEQGQKQQRGTEGKRVGDDTETTLARGILQSQGEKPPEGTENVHIPEEKMQYIHSQLQNRKADIERNMAKTPHLANMDTATSAASSDHTGGEKLPSQHEERNA
jgi:hypothetical protein